MLKLSFTRRGALTVSAAAAAGLIAGRYEVRAQAPEPTAVTPALIEAAKKEGKVVWYAAMDLPVSRAGRPRIRGEISRHCSADRAHRLRAPVPAARPGICRPHLRPRHHQCLRCGALRRLEAQRLARRLTCPRRWRAITRPSIATRTACYATSRVYVVSLGYNTNLVKAEDAPRSLHGPAAIRNGWARWSRRIRPIAAPS